MENEAEKPKTDFDTDRNYIAIVLLAFTLSFLARIAYMVWQRGAESGRDSYPLWCALIDLIFYLLSEWLPLIALLFLQRSIFTTLSNPEEIDN
jgi:hypothetical protein